MTALEAILILVLVGAVIVLVYYFIREMNRTGSANFGTVKSSFTEARRGVSDVGSSVSGGISQQYSGGNVEGDSRMSGVSERVSGMGEKFKGKVKEVPISTDAFSGRIDEFLNDQSDRLIKDWKLATKSDLDSIEKRINKVSNDVDGLAKRFDEFRGHANKKFENIDERLNNLEVKNKI
ncbi:hypothetical protein [Methanobacterium sp. ACI-7]|uniref:hypothetical protein n=1 Tax=unclassified Methanobacterium TaxID=2627676 RepID=UPI0039C1ABB6